jgi:hypothetical protein
LGFLLGFSDFKPLGHQLALGTWEPKTAPNYPQNVNRMSTELAMVFRLNPRF